MLCYPKKKIELSRASIQFDVNSFGNIIRHDIIRDESQIGTPSNPVQAGFVQFVQGHQRFEYVLSSFNETEIFLFVSFQFRPELRMVFCPIAGDDIPLIGIVIIFADAQFSVPPSPLRLIPNFSVIPILIVTVNFNVIIICTEEKRMNKPIQDICAVFDSRSLVVAASRGRGGIRPT